MEPLAFSLYVQKKARIEAMNAGRIWDIEMGPEKGFGTFFADGREPKTAFLSDLNKIREES